MKGERTRVYLLDTAIQLEISFLNINENSKLCGQKVFSGEPAENGMGGRR